MGLNLFYEYFFLSILQNESVVTSKSGDIRVTAEKQKRTKFILHSAKK